MLHLYTPHHNAGAEMAAHGLLRTLVARGHAVDVILSRDHAAITEPYEIDGVRVYPRVDKGDPARRLSSDEPPHVIVTHLENTDRASILGRIFRVPVVHLMHNTFGPTKRALTRQPALVVANTQWMADDVEEWWNTDNGGHPMPRTVVVRPPVAVEDYRTTPGTHVTLVSLTAEKGADVFYALADRFPRTKFLAVEGAYGYQDRRPRDNVTWWPHIAGDRMRDEVYRRTRILLVPSSYESYGRVAIEAACSGIPTIAHPTPGLRESLGDAGTFADRDDIDAWDQHLRRLLKPAAWAAASALATARADHLCTTADLDRWTTEVEAVSNHDPARAR